MYKKIFLRQGNEYQQKKIEKKIFMSDNFYTDHRLIDKNFPTAFPVYFIEKNKEFKHTVSQAFHSAAVNIMPYSSRN